MIPVLVHFVRRSGHFWPAGELMRGMMRDGDGDEILGAEERMYACIPLLECQIRKALDGVALSTLSRRHTGNSIFTACGALISGVRYQKGA